MSEPSKQFVPIVRQFLGSLSAAANRGLLLDIVVLVLNLGAMAVLSRVFLRLVREAAAEDQGAQWTLFGCAALLMVLAPLGATLKRWHFWQGRNAEGEELDGCLFSPVFYFCLTALIFATVDAFLLQTIYGNREPNGDVFVLSVFGGIALMLMHTWLVYRYFSRPESPPRWTFLRTRASAVIGDLCLFANMLLFQLAWNLLGAIGMPRPTGPVDVLFRVLVLLFLALLLYFPPRMFYLADDIGKRRTWLMIAIANAPIILRLVVGSERPPL